MSELSEISNYLCWVLWGDKKTKLLLLVIRFELGKKQPLIPDFLHLTKVVVMSTLQTSSHNSIFLPPPETSNTSSTWLAITVHSNRFLTVLIGSFLQISLISYSSSEYSPCYCWPSLLSCCDTNTALNYFFSRSTGLYLIQNHLPKWFRYDL